jgi:hypothetical protein
LIRRMMSFGTAVFPANSPLVVTVHSPWFR